MDELDAKLRKAMQALERSVPDAYFDDVSARIEARLENIAMTETEQKQDRVMPPTGRSVTAVPPRQDETSGLHDIKALAQSTKQRISKRVSTQSDAEELLHSSTAGLRAVALPVPSKEVTGNLVDPALGSSSATPATARAARGSLSGRVEVRPALADASEPRGGLPIWIYAGIGAVAVAAVVFFVIRGVDRSARDGGAADRQTVASTSPPASAATTPSVGRVATEAPPHRAEITPAVPEATEVRGGSAPTATAAAVVDPAGAQPASTPATKDDTAGAGDERVGKRDRDKQDAPGTGAAKGAGTPGATEPAIVQGDEAEKAAKDDKPKTPATTAGGGGASLEDLLREASGSAAKPIETREEEVKKPTKTKLDSGDLRAGMQDVDAQSCFDKYGVAGNVQIHFTVSPSGKVTKAGATGSFKGTDTGSCVARAVSKVSFPAFDGAPMSFTYPFMLAE